MAFPAEDSLAGHVAFQHHHEADRGDSAKPNTSVDASPSSHPLSSPSTETRRQTWDEDIARIAKSFKDRETQRTAARERDARAIDSTEERHRQFVKKAVEEPVRRIVEAFKRQRLEASVTILQDRVIGTVEGKSYAVHVEFQGEEPVAYDSYSPEPPRAIARGDVRGLTVEQLAEMVSDQFLHYIDQALRA